MIENAIAMVSSCIRRLSSGSGNRSPSTRITGWLPTLRCRSEALRSTAIFSRSLMFILALLLDLRVLRGPGEHCHRTFHRSQPAVTVRQVSAHQAVELGDEPLGHGPRQAVADH